MIFCSKKPNQSSTWIGLLLCVITAEAGTFSEKPDKIEDLENTFFISEIFEKYGNSNVMTFEGFEHLLENLGLGKLKFDTSHDVSIHKINGTFIEFHDELSLHKHNHTVLKSDKGELLETRETGNKRKRRNLNDDERVSNNDVKTVLRRKCLTAQDILSTYGLQPYHEVKISPSKYLHICPAIVYELDQKLCQAEELLEDTKEEKDNYLVWIYATVSITVMGVLGMLCAVLVPVITSTYFSFFLEFLISLAVGTLCGDALIHLTPQIFSNGQSQSNFMPIYRGAVVLIAIFFFFIIENALKRAQNVKVKNDDFNNESGKMLSLNKHEEAHNHGHSHGIKPLAWMIIMGDILHNVTDGLSIGAAFASSISSGFASSIAIFCHELPHELGDYAVLIASGMSIKKSLFYNFVSSVFSFIGMMAGVLLGEIKNASLWINAFTAGSFLYIALSDLIPEMKTTASKINSINFIIQIFGLSCGLVLMLSIALYEDKIEMLLR